ncbi:MAG: RNA polymerase sigma-70 factor [Cyclobacteriaceae bacterium]
MPKNQIASEDSFEGLFKESFNLYFEGLHRYAFTMLKDNAKASDAVQSVFLKWWENQTQVKDVNESKAYLYTAVYRTCLNNIRNEKSKVLISEEYLRQVGKTSTEDSFEFGELNDYLKNTIDELPPQCRIIFCKSRFEEKKYAEIAEEMNLSIKTVEAQMGKALKHLRERLKIYLLSPN